MTLPRLWNRYMTLIEGFHRMRVTYEQLEQNGLIVDQARKQLAIDFVEAFLRDCFSNGA